MNDGPAIRGEDTGEIADQTAAGDMGDAADGLLDFILRGASPERVSRKSGVGRSSSSATLHSRPGSSSSSFNPAISKIIFLARVYPLLCRPELARPTIVSPGSIISPVDDFPSFHHADGKPGQVEFVPVNTIPASRPSRRPAGRTSACWQPSVIPLRRSRGMFRVELSDAPCNPGRTAARPRSTIRSLTFIATRSMPTVSSLPASLAKATLSLCRRRRCRRPAPACGNSA